MNYCDECNIGMRKMIYWLEDSADGTCEECIKEIRSEWDET